MKDSDRMSRRLAWIAPIWLTASLAWASEVPRFNVVELSTRLASYNSHDDSARATYTCCKPEQKEQIAAALKANRTFLSMYPNSDYADDTLMHNARVYSVSRDFRHQYESLYRLASSYPSSDHHDDALWQLAELSRKDAMEAQQVGYLQRLVTQHPRSPYADRALADLAQAYAKQRNEAGAWTAAQQLFRRYPRSEQAPRVLYQLAQKYQEVGNYQAAMPLYAQVVNSFPFSDQADDAMFNYGACQNSRDLKTAALKTFQQFVAQKPGSPLARRAAEMANGIRQGSYNLEGVLPADIADDIWNAAMHYVRFQEYATAIQGFKYFIAMCPGDDRIDDAWFEIGKTFAKVEQLANQVRSAQGPEDLFQLADDWQRATGCGCEDRLKEMANIRDATAAFRVITSRLPGSPLADDAQYALARAFEEVDKTKEMALAFQSLLISYPQSPFVNEAMAKMFEWYADPQSYPESLGPYRLLSKAYPDIFPSWMADDEADYRVLMAIYGQNVAHAWSESHQHHIPYTYAPMDLQDDSIYVIGATQLKHGQVRQAAKTLAKMARYPRGDYAPLAMWLAGRIAQYRGRLDDARKSFLALGRTWPDGGLRDDAEIALAEIADPQGPPPFVEDENGYLLDLFRGEEVEVHAPVIASPKMRQYNMPNIWDRARAELRSWLHVHSREPQLIRLSELAPNRAGEVILLNAAIVNDPPAWRVGISELAYNAVFSGLDPALDRIQPALRQAFAQFAAARLEMNLVAETRDVIGAASVAKVAHEQVVRQREQVVNAFGQYLQQGADIQYLSAPAATGMLVALLDSQGYSAEEMLDWTPFEDFFRAWQRTKEDTGGASAERFVTAMSRAFNADLTQTFREWGFPVRTTAN